MAVSRSRSTGCEVKGEGRVDSGTFATEPGTLLSTRPPLDLPMLETGPSPGENQGTGIGLGDAASVSQGLCSCQHSLGVGGGDVGRKSVHLRSVLGAVATR